MDNIAEIVRKETDNLNNISTKDSRWLCWEYITNDFGNIEGLLKILPKNREILAVDLSNNIWKFAESVNDLCESISKNTIANRVDG